MWTPSNGPDENLVIRRQRWPLQLVRGVAVLGLDAPIPPATICRRNHMQGATRHIRYAADRAVRGPLCRLLQKLNYQVFVMWGLLGVSS
jgi:hypothetical protein